MHPRDRNQDHVTYGIQTLESDYIFHFQNIRELQIPISTGSKAWPVCP